MDTLQPWQQRVITERMDLEDKIYRLQTFLNEHEFDESTLVNFMEQFYLQEQCETMKKYLRILDWRISKFAKP